MSEREHAANSSQRGFRSGVLAASTPWLVRSDRPSSIDGAAGGLTIGPSGSSSIAPPKPNCAAPDSSATTRQGIKNTISPAGNVGERARRRLQSTRLSIRGVGGVDPVARSLRSPELHRRRRRRPHHRPERVEQHRAAEAKLRRAGFLGHHPPRDKEHHLASRKCRRESTPQLQSTRLSIRGVGGVDPVARSLRSPELHRRRRRRPHHRPERVEQHRAAEAKLRRAGFLGHHPPRDKEHHLASRKCRRESTPQTAPSPQLLKPDGCRAPPRSLHRAAGARHHQRLARASG